MDEKILKEMASTLQEIKEKLSAGSLGALRGPVADPGPEWSYPPRGPVVDFIRGPVADPGPSYLLDRARLAQLKIRRLDGVVADLERQIDSLKLERDLLKEEYNIK